MPFWQCVGTPQ
jgi:hypothetical protein